MSYSVPNKFIPGTKASPLEVNENFEYICSLLSTVTGTSSNFCVNSGARLSNSQENLLTATTDETGVRNIVSLNVPEEIKATTGSGMPFSVSEVFQTQVQPTVYVSMLPEFTSNSPFAGFSCSASINSSDAWKIFDKNEDTFWASVSGATEAEVSLNVEYDISIDRYCMKTLTELPSNYSLYGSTDSVTWDLLDSFTSFKPETVYREVENRGSYSFYKLHCEFLDTVDIAPFKIQEVDFYKKSDTGEIFFEETQKIYLSSTGLEARKSRIFRQISTPEKFRFYDAIIPRMEGNIYANYSITASGQTSQNLPYMATDSDLSSSWCDPDSLNESWIQIKLPNRKIASACKISIGTDEYSLSRALINGKIQGSDNGVNWNDLYVVKDLAWEKAGDSKTLYFSDNENSYFYYRIIGEAPFASIAEFQLYEANEEGQYYLGDAEEGDVWFKTSEPFGAFIMKEGWESYDSVPVGEITLDKNKNIISVKTYPYGQNGFSVNANTVSEYSGNVITKDGFSYRVSSSSLFSFPNKLIIQSGSIPISGKTTQVLFPSAFPNGVVSVNLTPITSEPVFVSVLDQDSQGFFAVVQNASGEVVSNVSISWIAFGW